MATQVVDIRQARTKIMLSEVDRMVVEPIVNKILEEELEILIAIAVKANRKLSQLSPRRGVLEAIVPNFEKAIDIEEEFSIEEKLEAIRIALEQLFQRLSEVAINKTEDPEEPLNYEDIVLAILKVFD